MPEQLPIFGRDQAATDQITTEPDQKDRGVADMNRDFG
jgi:hypothetical protein